MLWHRAATLNQSQKQAKKENDDYVDFYIELLQDPRFVSVSNDKWKIRNYITKDEFDRWTNSKYSAVDFYAPEDKGDEEIIDELIDDEVNPAQSENGPDREYEAEEDVDEEIDEENESSN